MPSKPRGSDLQTFLVLGLIGAMYAGLEARFEGGGLVDIALGGVIGFVLGAALIPGIILFLAGLAYLISSLPNVGSFIVRQGRVVYTFVRRADLPFRNDFSSAGSRTLHVVSHLFPFRINEEDVGEAIDAIRELEFAGASRRAIWLKVARTIIQVTNATFRYIFTPRLPTAQVDRAALHDLLLDVFDADELRLFIWRMKDGAELLKDLPERVGLSARVWFGLVIEAMERRKHLDEEFFELLKRERPRWADEIDKVRTGRGKK